MENNETKTLQEEDKTQRSSLENEAVKSPSIPASKDLSAYKYFASKGQKDSAGNHFPLPEYVKITDSKGASILPPEGLTPLPVNNQKELSALMAKAPYFDKDGVLQYGYNAPAPTQNEQIMAAFDAYIKHQPIISGLGVTNSPDSIKWAQSVYDAAHPQAQTQSATSAGASPQKANAAVLAIMPEIELPMPPASLPLDEIGNPFGPWYMPL